MTKRRLGLFVVVIGLVLLLAVVVGQTIPALLQSITDAETRRPVTMDGSDGRGGLVDPIDVWDDQQARTKVVAQVHDGDTVTLLLQRGDVVRIQTSTGVEGWVAQRFIKELR
jgi:hypothetical protein